MEHFNCTIQELKLISWVFLLAFPVNFNCTIQELKQYGNKKTGGYDSRFQLHHTGIKTNNFQQTIGVTGYFNCTIQELKQNGHKQAPVPFPGFQLHHTGIKTG